jgi:hypothetical protein
MLPCATCAYHAPVPDTAYTACTYDWTEATAPRGRRVGVQQGWYYFPVAFDPTWGPELCLGHATERNPARVAPPHAAATIMIRLMKTAMG